jgi:leucyl aminopeptidase
MERGAQYAGPVSHAPDVSIGGMTSLSLSNATPSTLKVDALVVGLHKGPKGPVLADGAAGVDRAFRGRLASMIAALGGTGRVDEVVKVPSSDSLAADLVVAVGLGEAPSASRRRPASYDPEVLRRAAGTAVRALAGTRRVGIALPAEDTAAVAAVAEGAMLGAYAFLRYRQSSRDSHKAPVGAVSVLTPNARDRATRAALTRATTIAEAVHWARDMVNTPPSDLPPKEFAAAATSATDGLPVKVTVLDERALKRGGYGGIVGVGQGSANPPRLVKIVWTHPQATKHLALVGKGITFDSGGLSLKPPQAMEAMKSDMGGAAAVIAAVAAIARLGLPVNVTAWVPMAENMPSGSAQRPSDVLTTYGGKTVEVLNTDAEGRLILADGIAAASEESPDLIVDVATLTGAQLVALGNRTAAIMSNDDEVRESIAAAAAAAGEQMWPMPLPPELRKSMDSQVADIANIGDRYGGMLVAGLFLKEFVGEGLRWAHLDIAGPAFNEGDPHGYTPKGGTGMAVRTLVRLAEDLSAGAT